MEQGASNLPNVQRSRSKGKLKFSEMKRSQSQSCTIRSTIPSTLSKRYENVEKIAMLMEDIHTKQLTKGEKAHEAVVQGFKEKIRSMFNELYKDYEHNKELISHQIRNLEKNKTSHIEVNNRFQQTLKQKNEYDKLKLQVEIKSKKLSKLREVLQREKSVRSEKEVLEEDFRKKLQQLKQQELIIQNLDYQRAILENMRVTRRTLKETLKQRFDDMFQEYSQRSRKINKFYNDNEVKKKLVADLAKQMPEAEIAIPENFAIELQDKLEHLYGKEAFQNIFYHQSIKNEEANREQHEREMQERQMRRKIREELEREEKKELDRVELEYIKNKELQEKFFKHCGIRSLAEIIDDRTGENREALEALKNELEGRIESINEENEELGAEIQRVLSRNTDAETNIRDLQRQYNKEHEEEKKLNYIAQKNGKFLEQLQSIIDRITEEPGPIEDMNLKLAKFSSKYEKMSEMKRKERSSQKSGKRFLRVPEIQISKNQTENTVLVDKQEQYLQQQFRNAKKQ